MSWTSARELQAQVSRLWERGELLREAIEEKNRFPLRLVLKGPASDDLGKQFDAVRSWIRELEKLPHVCILWREFNHRVVGRQRLPQWVHISKLDEALALIGKREDYARFERMVERTRERQPELLPWLEKRPLQALDVAAQWDKLLAVVEWVRSHPRPGVYLRQVDLPGIDSKFIESQRGVLGELLDLILPPAAIAAEHSGVSRFAQRYGFREKPQRIRFRPLDPKLVPGLPLADLTLDADSFAALELPLARVFITENEINFLCFPPAEASIVVFGAGYGWDALARAGWLRRCRILYWGDIDTHGFAILDQLRSRFEHVESLLMDHATLFAHEAMWGEEADPVSHELSRLTDEERALFEQLRKDEIRPKLRLEQERIGFDRVKKALARVLERG